MKYLALALLVGCAQPDTDDRDLDGDAELAQILGDAMPEVAPVDANTVEMPAARVACTRQRFLHFANWSFIAKLGCVNGVCPNGCWGSQQRTSGFACDYDASQADFVATHAGDGPFASYNEIKSLNAHDAAAVASCRAQSGGRPLRTYTVWNGSGWDSEGISASIHFAELYGTQHEATPHFWTWFANSRGGYAPMSNISPETGLDFVSVKKTVARICAATRDGWVGLYFYDGNASGGAGMSDWKREAIVRGMNYCTTH